MSSSLEQLVNRLVEEGSAIVAAPRRHEKFAYDEEADELINDIEHYPQAFVLGSLCNRQGPARGAWRIPSKIQSRHKTLDIGELTQLNLADWQEITQGLRMSGKMALVLLKGVEQISTEYGGDASAIWKGLPRSTTVVRRFLEFHGAGPKIATMATNILVRSFKVPLDDYQDVDISVDRKTMRVMERMGFVRRGERDSRIFTYAAREEHPEFPGIFDKVLWLLAEDVCVPTRPRCHECRFNDLCRYANEKT
jgi:endonuclease III